MADHEYTLTKLSVDVSHDHGADTLSFVFNFMKGLETFKVTLPAMPRDELRQFVSRFNYAISREQIAAELVGGDSFTVDLIE